MAFGIDLEEISRRSRDHDIIEWPHRQLAEHGEKPAAATMNENDLVGGRIAIKFLLRLGRPAARHDDVGICINRHAAGHRIALGRHVAGLRVNVPERKIVDDVQFDMTGGFTSLTRVGGLT